MRFFGRKRGGVGRVSQAEEAYLGLRQQVLDLTPDQLGGGLASGAPVIAGVMEIGYPEAVATLVGVIDGTTSLYFSNGGGVIGAGGHSQVADATGRWLQTCADFLPHLSAAIRDPPPPGLGLTQFVAVTPNGLLGAVAPEAELGEGGHALSPLFYAAQDVITQIRLAEEA